MYDGFVCSQSRQCQCPDFGTNTHLLPLLSFFWELNIVLQSQALSNKMVIDQIKNTSWKQIGRNIKISRISRTEFERIYGKPMVRYVRICGRKYRRFGGRKRRRLSVVIRMV